MDIDINPIQIPAMVTTVVYSTTIALQAVFRDFKSFATAIRAFNRENKHHLKAIKLIPFRPSQVNEEIKKRIRYRNMLFKCSAAEPRSSHYRKDRPGRNQNKIIEGVLRKGCDFCPSGCLMLINVKYVPEINALKVDKVRSFQPTDKPCDDLKNRSRCQCKTNRDSEKILRKMNEMTL